MEQLIVTYLSCTRPHWMIKSSKKWRHKYTYICYFSLGKIPRPERFLILFQRIQSNSSLSQSLSEKSERKFYIVVTASSSRCRDGTRRKPTSLFLLSSSSSSSSSPSSTTNAPFSKSTKINNSKINNLKKKITLFFPTNANETPSPTSSPIFRDSPVDLHVNLAFFSSWIFSLISGFRLVFHLMGSNGFFSFLVFFFQRLLIGLVDATPLEITVAGKSSGSPSPVAGGGRRVRRRKGAMCSPASGYSTTVRIRCTMSQGVRTCRTSWRVTSMAGMIWATSTGDGNPMDAIWRGQWFFFFHLFFFFSENYLAWECTFLMVGF